MFAAIELQHVSDADAAAFIKAVKELCTFSHSHKHRLIHVSRCMQQQQLEAGDIEINELSSAFQYLFRSRYGKHMHNSYLYMGYTHAEVCVCVRVCLLNDLHIRCSYQLSQLPTIEAQIKSAGHSL